MNELLDTTGEDTQGTRRLRALVIGGGIAGIQAALDLANARIPVTVVEKGPALGGRMAQLDKTFPTMDCAI
jgi:heterodisulfide reductase subunit A